MKGEASVPTVTDNLFHDKVIKEELIGISYAPTTSAAHVANGEVTFGVIDPEKYMPP